MCLERSTLPVFHLINRYKLYFMVVQWHFCIWIYIMMQDYPVSVETRAFFFLRGHEEGPKTLTRTASVSCCWDYMFLRVSQACYKSCYKLQELLKHHTSALHSTNISQHNLISSQCINLLSLCARCRFSKKQKLKGSNRYKHDAVGNMRLNHGKIRCHAQQEDSFPAPKSHFLFRVLRQRTHMWLVRATTKLLISLKLKIIKTSGLHNCQFCSAVLTGN